MVRSAAASRRRLIIGAAIVLVPLIAFAVIYLVFFTSDSPDRLRLSTDDTTTGGISAADLAGRWTVGSGSEAGYRVREKLAALPAKSDAVGRSSAVTGGFVVAESGGGLVASDGQFEVDLTQLKSDKSQRDNRIRTSGLETDRFPKATFVSSSDVKVPARAGTGKAVKILVRGELTIHGITRTVAIPVDTRASRDQVELVGSLNFPMSDFGVTPPSIGGFVTVDNDATLEFRLVMRKG